MCQACDLLKGLEPAALVPDEVLRREPVHYVEGPGTAPLSALYPQQDSPLAGRVRRYTPPGSDIHGEDAAWRAWRDAVLAAGEGVAPPLWRPGVAAAEAFRHFKAGQDDGLLPQSLRFVLAWPTPATLLGAAATDATLALLESAFIAELSLLPPSLPPALLTLQWSASGETRLWETRGRDIASRQSLPQRVLQGHERLAKALSQDMELAFHFCRRDAWSDEAAAVAHAAQVTRLIGALLAACERPLAYVHVNVPAQWQDPEAFDTLANLIHWPDLEVHLGLVRPSVASAATEDRLQLARLALPYVAPSAPCGVDPSQVLPLLETLPRVALGHEPEEAFS